MISIKSFSDFYKSQRFFKISKLFSNLIRYFKNLSAFFKNQIDFIKMKILFQNSTGDFKIQKNSRKTSGKFPPH